MNIHFEPGIGQSFHTYKTFFVTIWSECMKAGFSSQDAREYAQIEWNNLVESVKTKNK